MIFVPFQLITHQKSFNFFKAVSGLFHSCIVGDPFPSHHPYRWTPLDTSCAKVLQEALAQGGIPFSIFSTLSETCSFYTGPIIPYTSKRSATEGLKVSRSITDFMRMAVRSAVFLVLPQACNHDSK